MKNNTQSAKATANTKNKNTEVDADVLYQKLGDRWYAFTELNGEVFMSPISDLQLSAIRHEVMLNSIVDTSFIDLSIANANNMESGNEAA